jgi:adenylate cyclase class IV
VSADLFPGRNIEIKARVEDLDALESRAAALADSGPFLLVQTDTFFTVPNGRLKLRVFPDGTGELIRYLRPDCLEPTGSDYTIYPTRDPALLHDALARALGLRGVVRKSRSLYLVGQTRIHLDRVERLGAFAELEVVLTAGQPPEAGQKIATQLMADLGITAADLVEPAYIDLLERL